MTNPYTAPTQQRLQTVQRLHHRRRRGCLMTGVLGLLMTLFICGASLMIYVVFPPRPLDILVMGLDSRQNEGMTSRTDSIMLIGIDPSRLRVNLLSIPRDLFFQVPGYGMERINTVNVLGELESAGGGPALLMETLNLNFNIGIDRYVRLDFEGFKALVDAVGGVDIYVERTIVDTMYPTEDYGVETVRFESGWQNMNGDRALKFARTRYTDDDYARAKRQQQVVAALGVKLLIPWNWPGAVSVMSRYTDANLTVFDIAYSLPPILLSAGRYNQLVIDRDYIQGTEAGYAVPNYSLLNDWVQDHFD